ncbi:hypothetical protein L208DRAFT_1408030 [Tricholoma matsutake]|nr:hypothetical protein L208DRAFT_1408030 [Tricholoma matsutake 945]
MTATACKTETTNISNTSQILNNVPMFLPSTQASPDLFSGEKQATLFLFSLVPIKKQKSGALAGMGDYPLSEVQKARADLSLLFTPNDVAFSVSENWFFLNFLNELWPLYEAPSRYVLSHSIMDAEAASSNLSEASSYCSVATDSTAVSYDRKRLTLLIDGWEDILRPSLYGSVAVEVGQYLSVLSLTDMTGNHATNMQQPKAS